MRRQGVVRVILRSGIDILSLLDENNYQFVSHCGRYFSIIANKVKENNGAANIEIHLIRSAVDTQEGVHAIMDNFDLEDPQTKKPLLFDLLGEREKI